MKSLTPTIFEISQNKRHCFRFDDSEFANISEEEALPASHQRQLPLELPQVSELDLVRHYTALSRRNCGIDNLFYPLGSCTMKYNPKVNEEIASLETFSSAHPLLPSEAVQGCLAVLEQLQTALCTITGMDAFTLQPAAGAHGELTGIMLMKKYHQSKGQHEQKTKMLVPDSAHGTNPASAALCGYTIVTLPTDEQGEVDLDFLQTQLGPDVAGLMLTNPNTLGLYDRNIMSIAELIHSVDGLLYYDGANLNAVVGKCKPGDMGFDVMHVNVHKTFSTPHGGGGPGAGPVGVKKHLEPFLPVPRIQRQGENFVLDHDHPQSIGRLVGFHGNFLIALRALTYIKELGRDGLKSVSEMAVLNANYLLEMLKASYAVPFQRRCMHEFVLSSAQQQEYGVHTKQLAKRLIDKGVHPPTTYFPLIVDEALMIEPTEVESKQTLDDFVQAMQDVAQECMDDPQKVLSAPHSTDVSQLDEVRAARQPILRWRP